MGGCITYLLGDYDDNDDESNSANDEEPGRTSYLSFFLQRFSPHKFRTKRAKISIKLHKLFKFFTEV